MSLDILPKISSPKDIRSMSIEELESLSRELREYTIDTITQIGGHLASTLGAIEITVALHYVYNTPKDKIVWDVGHQAYAHKILTGRFGTFPTIRQMGGISGFLKRSESKYDVFGAGHASTSISAALGIAVARDNNKDDFRVVAVIGDGSMTGGLAFEGLNNAGSLRKQLLVILNDNNMSISPNVGAIKTHLTRVVTNPLYNRIRDEIWHLTGALPFGKARTRKLMRKVEEGLKNLVVPGIIFDELGFRYFGPIDGHDVGELVNTLENIKNIKTPVLLHIVTKKGKGMKSAEDDPVFYHGVKGVPVEPDLPKPKHETSSAPSFQTVFGYLACEIARHRKDTVAITAAMREGTGLVPYAKEFPHRYFDVGIAEGHAITFAAGITTENVRPLVAIYSTFIQRAFDHIVHDAALQNLPVILCLDRAGIAGEDGPTHHGTLDIVFLRCIQNIIVSAPANGNEFRHLLYTALNQSKQPFAIRYPKSGSVIFDEDGQAELIPIGQWEIMQNGTGITILCVGPFVYDALKAAGRLKKMNINCEVVNCRFIKPMDEGYLNGILKNFTTVVTIEEGVKTGGFGEGVSAWLIQNGFKGSVKVLSLPDEFIEHGPRTKILEKLGLSATGIETAIREINVNQKK